MPIPLSVAVIPTFFLEDVDRRTDIETPLGLTSGITRIGHRSYDGLAARDSKSAKSYRTPVAPKSGSRRNGFRR